MDIPADRPTLLLTRPAKQSERFAAEFRGRFGRNWPIVIAPLTELRQVPAMLDLEGVTALVFTSETGVAAFAALTPRRDIPAWAVGPRTAQAARAAGFTATEGPGDGAGLAGAILRAGHRGPVLCVRGLHQAFDMRAGLGSFGIETKEAILYEQTAIELTAEALAVLNGPRPVLVPLFSPRAAALLSARLPAEHAPLWLASLSPAVADAAGGIDAARRLTASTPDAPAMLDAIAQLLGKARPVT